MDHIPVLRLVQHGAVDLLDFLKMRRKVRIDMVDSFHHDTGIVDTIEFLVLRFEPAIIPPSLEPSGQTDDIVDVRGLVRILRVQSDRPSPHLIDAHIGCHPGEVDERVELRAIPSFSEYPLRADHQLRVSGHELVRDGEDGLILREPPLPVISDPPDPLSGYQVGIQMCIRSDERIEEEGAIDEIGISIEEIRDDGAPEVFSKISDLRVEDFRHSLELRLAVDEELLDGSLETVEIPASPDISEIEEHLLDRFFLLLGHLLPFLPGHPDHEPLPDGFGDILEHERIGGIHVDIM